MQVGKRQVTNVMKEIIVDLVKIPRDMINWLSFIYLSYCISFGITIRLRAVSLFLGPSSKTRLTEGARRDAR